MFGSLQFVAPTIEAKEEIDLDDSFVWLEVFWAAQMVLCRDDAVAIVSFLRRILQ